jgi:dGTPase
VNWESLLSTKRRRLSTVAPDPDRHEFERDYDRLLFSTPVRRLADKTQVFPLEEHDSVRTRLTHSLEVSNLARGLGIAIARRFEARISLDEGIRSIPALLASAALVHDIGNPPFGHQGEVAIQSWFAGHSEALQEVEASQQQDFLRFEGNAQALRILMRLQILDDETGLNLTFATLAVLMKYTGPAHEADRNAKLASLKKPGFFQSEADLVSEIRAECGLAGSQRHPFAYLVEACDDIAYSTVDAEDAVKKGLASLPDLVAHLRTGEKDRVVDEVVSFCESEQAKVRGIAALTPAELNDILMQKFRTVAIGKMVPIVREAFLTNLASIEAGTFEGDLIANSEAQELRQRLKVFDRAVAYSHRDVVRIEALGERVIHSLMSELWAAINTSPEARTARMRYVASRVSKNYLRAHEHAVSRVGVPYARAQLLADMIAGMTDRFAVSLYHDFEGLRGE